MNENQKKILKLAKKKNINKLGYREIARELKILNPQTVKYHLEELKRRGLIYFDAKRHRSNVAKPNAFIVDKLFSLPILGAANAGKPLEIAHEDIQGYLKITPRAVGKCSPKGLFVVRTVGNSLDRANIHGSSIEDGDLVIIDSTQQPQDGDYVLSVIDDAANIKKFYKNDKTKQIKLVSESTLDIPPIVLHEGDLKSLNYMVNGVVIKVVKIENE